MQLIAKFTVPGLPRPGGSKKAFFNRHTGRAHIVDTSKYVKDWRAAVAAVAYEATKDSLCCPVRGALTLVVTLYLPRPKSHYRANGEVKVSAPPYPVTKPDTTKLLRSTEDALTGIVWKDDSQIVEQFICKKYGEKPRAEIEVLECK